MPAQAGLGRCHIARREQCARLAGKDAPGAGRSAALACQVPCAAVTAWCGDQPVVLRLQLLHKLLSLAGWLADSRLDCCCACRVVASCGLSCTSAPVRCPLRKPARTDSVSSCQAAKRS